MRHPLNGSMSACRRWLLVAGALLPVLAYAGDVKVFVAGAAKAAVETLATDYERASGDTVRARFDTVGALQLRITQGERPDLVILSAAAVNDLVQRGLTSADDRADLGVVVAGIAVRKGVPVPDIGSTEALKQTLLAATSIGQADGARGATSGAHFSRVLAALDLRETLAGRLTVLPFGVDVVQGVAEGRFEIGVSQSSEILPNPGVTYVGGLPPPYDLRTPYVAAVLGASEAGRRLLAFLRSDGARVVLERSGLVRP
jgi:molybdate transport system substrate-binding protein